MPLTLSIFKIYVNNIQYYKYTWDCPLVYLVIHFQITLLFIGRTSPLSPLILIKTQNSFEF